MARAKNSPEAVKTKHSLAERLRTLRIELYGERGGPELARSLGIPVRTWYNYEAGVTVPAEVALKIVELTAVEPLWLLRGTGVKFREETAGETRRETSVAGLLRQAIERLEQGRESSRHEIEPGRSVHELPGTPDDHIEEGSDFVLISVEDEGRIALSRVSGPRYIAARREWLSAERECRCVQVEGEAMSPIISAGAYVAFAETEEPAASLDGKLVVVWIDGRPMVRWFQYSGQFALLKTENDAAEMATTLIELDAIRASGRGIRRVLWINTPH
jgi:DNA-binding transcriptional regulator YiaG